MPVGRPVGLPRPRIASGQRDKRVTIQSIATGAGTSGFPTETATDLATVWMARKDERADERFGAAQESAYYETIWHMEYRSDMDPELVDVPKTRQLVYRGRTFNIRSATLLDRRIGIEMVTLAQSGIA